MTEREEIAPLITMGEDRLAYCAMRRDPAYMNDAITKGLYLDPIYAELTAQRAALQAEREAHQRTREAMDKDAPILRLAVEVQDTLARQYESERTARKALEAQLTTEREAREATDRQIAMLKTLLSEAREARERAEATAKAARNDYDTYRREYPPLARLASALIAKLDVVHPHMVTAFQMMQIHGMPYSGPTYGVELEALRAAIPPAEIDYFDEAELGRLAEQGRAE